MLPPTGLFPCVRGEPAASSRSRWPTRVYPRCGRFIPACAGNSSRPPCAGRGGAVHPRVCGELFSSSVRGSRGRGSSPRVRGTPPGLEPQHPQQPVHPRVCGELLPPCTPATCSGGSSPRVRGTHHARRRGRRQPRFIPACAGNSGGRPSRRRRPPVHPRVCGELSKPWLVAVASPGSSPRVRGTPTANRAHRAGGRFIPACAGNSACPPPSPSSPTVHPRVCGELPGGSGRGQARRRFIPACAGNSNGPLAQGLTNVGSSPRVRGTRGCHAGPRPALPVHPRVCGELRLG